MKETWRHKWGFRYEKQSKKHWEKAAKKVESDYGERGDGFVDDMWRDSPKHQYRAMELLARFGGNDEMAGQLYGGLLVRYAGANTRDDLERAIEFLSQRVHFLDIKIQSIVQGWQIFMATIPAVADFLAKGEVFVEHFDYVTRKMIGRERLAKDYPEMADLLEHWRRR